MCSCIRFIQSFNFCKRHQQNYKTATHVHSYASECVQQKCISSSDKHKIYEIKRLRYWCMGIKICVTNTHSVKDRQAVSKIVILSSKQPKTYKSINRRESKNFLNQYIHLWPIEECGNLESRFWSSLISNSILQFVQAILPNLRHFREREIPTLHQEKMNGLSLVRYALILK